MTLPRRYCSLASAGAAALLLLFGGASASSDSSGVGVDRDAELLGDAPFDLLAGSPPAPARASRATEGSRSLRGNGALVVAAATPAPDAEEATKSKTPPAPAKITAAPAAAANVAPQPLLSVVPAKVATGGVGLVTVRGLAEGDTVTGTFSGEAIPFQAGNGIATALFGVDLDVKPGKYMVRAKVARGGKTIPKDLSVTVFDGKYPEQSFTVPKEKDVTEGDVELGKRIVREAKALSVIWPEWTPERKWVGGFAAPAPGTMKNFGSKRIINGKPRRAHTGADQSGKTGDPIHAINDGTVVFAADQFFGGNTTVVDHGHGLYSMYMHQSKMDVQPGQSVKKGDKIGEVGMTGRATGAHLHWGLRLLGARVDPAKLLALSKELDALEAAVTQPAVAAPMTAGTGGGPASGG